MVGVRPPSIQMSLIPSLLCGELLYSNVTIEEIGHPSGVYSGVHILLNTLVATNVFKRMWTPEYTPEGCPISSMVTLEYNNSPHNKDGIKLIWMDGGLTPTIPEEIEDEFIMNYEMGNSSGIMMLGAKGL